LLGRAQRDKLVRIIQRDIFAIDLRGDLKWQSDGGLLVVGNPPWVTNSQLGSIGSTNVPKKLNLKRLKGIEALTGASNFDIAEYIWIKLISELSVEAPTISLLCKTSVARNVLEFASRNALPIAGASIHKIDAGKWFGASVDACLFTVKVSNEHRDYKADVYADLTSTEREAVLQIIHGQLVVDAELYAATSYADGTSPVVWRQGIKHDAAAIMELRAVSDHEFLNGLGDHVAVEDEFLFPLLKCTDLWHGRTLNPMRWVIVTQRRLGEDTAPLQKSAPRLWSYLVSHDKEFVKRKSAVYRTAPPFSLFGIGDYAFSPFKVAVSGLHKFPRFRAVGPFRGKPVMLDDTCYFLPCHGALVTAAVSALLNCPDCVDLLRSLVLPGAKRPVTKKLLQRLDLRALLEKSDSARLVDDASAILDSLGTGETTEEADVMNALNELLGQTQHRLFVAERARRSI